MAVDDLDRPPPGCVRAPRVEPDLAYTDRRVFWALLTATVLKVGLPLLIGPVGDRVALPAALAAAVVLLWDAVPSRWFGYLHAAAVLGCVLVVYRS